MKLYRLRFLPFVLFVIAMSLVLTACGGEEEATPTQVPPAADTPAPPPTDTPVPAPTDTPLPPPTNTPEPEIGADFIPFESAEGGFTLRYPDDWFTTDLLGFAVFASTEELLDSPDAGEKGGVTIVIAADTTDFEATDPVAVLEAAAVEFTIADDAEMTEGPTAVTINGQEAATAVIKGTTDNGTPLSAFLTIIINGDRTVVVLAATPTESEEEFRAQFDAIAKSIEVGTPTEPVAGNPELPVSEGVLAYGDTKTGTVPSDGDTTWEFDGLEGQAVDIIVTPLDDNLDVVLDLFDEAGVSLLDDEFDDSFDVEELRNVTLPTSGSYTIYLRGFAGSGGNYEITLIESGLKGTTGTTTSEPVANGQISYGDSVDGIVTAAAPSTWGFVGQEGDAIDIIVRPQTDELDVIIDLLDESGNSMLAAEIDDSFGIEELRNFILPASGEYTISIHGFGGSVGEYEVTLAEAGMLTGTEGTIAYGQIMEGSVIADDGSVWRFSGAAGDLVDITVTPFNEFDLVVNVLDATGSSILDEGPTDDSFDTEFIRVLRLPNDGQYIIDITGYEGEIGDYEIMLALSNGGQPGSIVFTNATLGAEDAEGHAFPFTAAADEVVTLQIDPEVGLDVVIEVYNDDTDDLLDEVDGYTGFEEMAFVVPENGNYYFLVKPFEDSTGNYSAIILGTDEILIELAFGDKVLGRFDNDGLITYILQANAGDSLVVTIENSDQLDTLLKLMDLDDNVLAEVNDAAPGGTETLTYTFTEDLITYIEVDEISGQSGQFTLLLDIE